MPTIPITCSITGESKEVEALKDGSPSLPVGWRRLGDRRVVSKAAWAKHWRPRAVRLPIASVAIEGANDTTAAWASFRADYRAAARDAAAYANAAQLRYGLLDAAVPLADGPKGKTLPKIDRDTAAAWDREVYALGEQFPAIDSQTRAQIRNDARSDYKAIRWDLRVLNKAVRQGYRSGYPIPFPASTIKHALDPGNGWHRFRVRLNGTPYWLRVTGDRRQYGHALASLARIGQDAELGQVSVSDRRVFGDNTHREQGLIYRDGERRQLILTAIVYLPVSARGGEPEKPLHVMVGDTPLLSCRVGENERTWQLHAEDLFRGLAAARSQAQRLADDRKFERRVKPDRAAFERRIGDCVERRRRWLDDRLHKVARELVGFAERSRCGLLSYDDSATTLGPRYKLRSLVEQKCGESGIRFVAKAASDTHA